MADQQPENTLTLEKLHAVLAALPSQFRQGQSNHLIIPWDDVQVGKLLEIIEVKSGQAFTGSGDLNTHLTNTLGCQVTGTDGFGVWYEVPALPSASS